MKRYREASFIEMFWNNDHFAFRDATRSIELQEHFQGRGTENEWHRVQIFARPYRSIVDNVERGTFLKNDCPLVVPFRASGARTAQSYAQPVMNAETLHVNREHRVTSSRDSIYHSVMPSSLSVAGGGGGAGAATAATRLVIRNYSRHGERPFLKVDGRTARWRSLLEWDFPFRVRDHDEYCS